MSAPIIIEEIARGQWHAICPDGVSRGVVNWVEALSGALRWAEMDGLAVISRDPHGEEHHMLAAREEAR